MAVVLVLCLVSSFVLAQGEGTEARGEDQGAGEGQEVQQETQNQGEESQIMVQEGSGEQNRLQQGLDNALSQVRNENAKQKLEQNVERFQERYSKRMRRMEGLEITEVDEETGAVKLQAREEVKFLGLFKAKVKKGFEIDANGNIEEKQPWYRFMYKNIEN